MIKGIISLFTSGIIFNPLVLLGIAFGVFCMATKDAAAIQAAFKDFHLYVLVLILSTAYVFVFKKVYKDNGDNLDWGIMIFQSVLGVAKFAVAAVLTISFVVMLSF